MNEAMDTTGLTRCYRCGALYKDGFWYLVRYEGTSSTPELVSKIPDGHCPICLKPPQIGDEPEWVEKTTGPSFADWRWPHGTI